MSQISDIIFESDSESLIEESDLGQSEEESFSDYSGSQSEDDENHSEVNNDSGDDSEIRPRCKRRTRYLSSSDSESSPEELDQWI